MNVGDKFMLIYLISNEVDFLFIFFIINFAK